jgi:integrase
VKPVSKTGAERVVPLTRRALDAVEEMTMRIDTPILFPAPRGGYIDLERWRFREWTPALRAARIDHRRIYDMRHTFATWSIAKGVPSERDPTRRHVRPLAARDCGHGARPARGGRRIGRTTRLEQAVRAASGRLFRLDT